MEFGERTSQNDCNETIDKSHLNCFERFVNAELKNNNKRSEQQRQNIH